MKNLSVKDLINVGIFTALYIVVMMAIVTVAGTVPILYLIAPFFTAIGCAIIYMLLAIRVPKLGSILLLSGFIAVLFLSTNWYASIFVLLCGITSELILNTLGRQTIKGIRISYLAMACSTAGPYLGLLFAKEALLLKTIEYYGQGYADTLRAITPSWIIIPILLLGFVGGLIGNKVALKILQKHFKKAGVI